MQASKQKLQKLFQQTKQNVSLHIGNVFKKGELQISSVVKESLKTASDGNKILFPGCNHFRWLQDQITTWYPIPYLGKQHFKGIFG